MQRNTKQREVIVACFAGEERPMTSTEVHALARKDCPSLGIATVYRAINALTKAGVLVSLVIGGATRYELAAKPHHHHFYCQECDRAFCLEACAIPKEDLAPQGFSVHGHDTVLFGACPACASNAERGSPEWAL